MNHNLEKKPVKLEINLDNLAHNFLEVRRFVKDKIKIMAIVKGNSYGHGAVETSKIFMENGADYLGVSILSEGIELRKAKIEGKILLLNYTPVDNFRKLLEYNLIPSIYNYNDAVALSEIAVKMGKEVKIHLNIDTGMTRLGFLPNENTFLEIHKISHLPNIIIDGIYSHFVKPEELDKTYSRQQYNKFIGVVNKLQDMGIGIGIRHISSSAAIIDLPEYNLDMVRPGLILYGHYPSNEVNKNILDLKSTMSLKATISNIKKVPIGTGVSYNHIFVTKRESIIGTLPLGYADGYSRRYVGKAVVFVKDRCVPIVGKICMDQMMIDITDISEVNIGDEVILFGYENENYPTIEDLARIFGTINYEIFCSMGRRIPRVYKKKDEIVSIVDYLTD